MSDGREETRFLQTLRKTLIEIPGLARWIEPRDVVVASTLEEAMIEQRFDRTLIVIHDVDPDEDPHSMGASGDMTISAFITVVVNPGVPDDEAEPTSLIGEDDGQDPALSAIDGLIRNTLHDSVLGGLAYSTRLSGGGYAEVPEDGPDHAVARQYLFTAFLEVTR